MGLSGGLMAKTPCFQCRGPGFDPWSGNETLHDPMHTATNVVQPKRK